MERSIQIPRGLLHICPQYGEGRGPCSSQECMNLHVCRPWLAGYCKMGASCEFEHSLFNPHNRRILEEKQVYLSPSEESLRQRICKSLPTLCFHCNVDCFTCEKNCPKIHLCRELVSRGICISKSVRKGNTSRCLFAHELHPLLKEQLRQYGIDIPSGLFIGSFSPEQIRTLFSDVICEDVKHTRFTMNSFGELQLSNENANLTCQRDCDSRPGQSGAGCLDRESLRASESSCANNTNRTELSNPTNSSQEKEQQSTTETSNGLKPLTRWQKTRMKSKQCKNRFALKNSSSVNCGFSAESKENNQKESAIADPSNQSIDYKTKRLFICEEFLRRTCRNQKVGKLCKYFHLESPVWNSFDRSVCSNANQNRRAPRNYLWQFFLG